ncbi:hypothetical protein NU688_33170 [Variovorax sp. ZS18.2.2]|uniref:hypothetical protein n=1 Tax=Variovorax sp. ZS18.2.2 TaxID=2971255 RepID=UPI0021518758|nr:hypothetical protein [Variovorax sp. ZS18.2.2]MCR6481050.1 hypothetical protein [Variovorax sp. ZS18.2.2]
MSLGSQSRPHAPNGQLALIYCGHRLKLQVLKSAAGHYIGTANEDGPVSRESCEYFGSEALAIAALETGEWSQHDGP